MAEFNKIRFFIFLSLIYSSHALEFLLADFDTTFYYSSVVKVDSRGIYVGRSFPSTVFKAQNETVKVILYVCSLNQFLSILDPKNDDERREIAEELWQMEYELLYLALVYPTLKDLNNIVGEFILETIKTDTNNTLSIEILGEGTFHTGYQSTKCLYGVYVENPPAHLRIRFDAMAKKDGRKKTKQIKHNNEECSHQRSYEK